MVGAHERSINGKFRELRLAWKKKKHHDRGTSPYHFPVCSGVARAFPGGRTAHPEDQNEEEN